MSKNRKILVAAAAACLAAGAYFTARSTLSQERTKADVPAAPAAAADKQVETPALPVQPAAALVDSPPAGDPNAGLASQPGGGIFGGLQIVPIPGPAASEQDRQAHEESSLAQQAASLTAAYAQTEDEALRKQTLAELASVLEKQFTLQQQRREREIAAIEARVKKLRDLLAKRETFKKQIIDGRIDQIVKEAEGLGWQGGPPSTPGLTELGGVTGATGFGGAAGGWVGRTPQWNWPVPVKPSVAPRASP